MLRDTHPTGAEPPDDSRQRAGERDQTVDEDGPFGLGTDATRLVDWDEEAGVE
jgi:hypothetical protein